MRIKIDNETRERFRAILGQLVAYVRSKPDVTRDELVLVGSQEGVTALTISEWIDRATDSLFAAGVLISRDFDVLADHLAKVTAPQLEALGQRILAYAEDHPLTWMIDAERAQIEAAIGMWQDEPDMVPNDQKIIQLDRLHRELEVLG